jgi:hypothetical protein
MRRKGRRGAKDRRDGREKEKKSKGHSSNCAATYNVELQIHFISVYHRRPLALTVSYGMRG